MKTTTTSIRKATLDDCGLIHQLAVEIFPATYCHILTPEQIDYMMEWMYSIESLTRQMEKEGHVYFLLYEGETLCGYVSIQREKEDLFHLQKIYLHPDVQGKGYGKLLFEQAKKYIKEVSPSPCIMELNVNRNNSAVEFYKRMGMEIVREGDFPIGNGFFMNDYIMAVVV